MIIQTAVDAVSLGSLYALFALGIGLIFGVMQLINFAHGELIMITGYALVLVAGVWLPGEVIVGIGAAMVFAVAMERVAFRPVRGANPATLLVTSFAVSVILQSAAEMLFGSLPRGVNVSTTLAEYVRVGPILIPKLSIVTVAVTLGFLVSFSAFLKRTPLGIQMRAAAENFPMARLMGVRANRVVASAFLLSGLLAGLAGFLVVAQTGSVSPNMGVSIVVIAFVATILGGMGSLVGSVVGGFVLGGVTVVLQTVLPLELLPFRDAFVFGLVFVMLILRPQGLIVGKAMIGRV